MARRTSVSKNRAIELLAKAISTPSATVSTVDPKALSAMVSAQLGAMYQAPPESMEAALIEQGMQWVRPFAPGRPLNPYEGYNGPPRAWNFTPGINVQLTPRYGRVSFNTLTSLVTNYDIAQIAGQHHINDVRTMDLQFLPMTHVKENIDDELAIARAFFEKPDKRLTFRNWLAKWAYDVIHYDAGCLYKRRDRAGRLFSLEVVDGRTVIPLLDYYGREPLPEDEFGNMLADIPPGYMQIIQGIPWVWMEAKDVVYEPLNPVSGSNYGIAPIEQILLNANLDLRFQWHFLNFFTEGSIPKGFMEAPPDMSQPDQLVEWQTTWEALVQGDQAKKWQMRWVPWGSKFTSIGAEQFDADFPVYMMRRTVAAYRTTPQDLGITLDVNRANGETQADIQFRIGTMPDVNYFQDQINLILKDELGLQVRCKFNTGQEVKDRLTTAQEHAIWIQNGVESPDEARRDVLGLHVDPSLLAPRYVFSARAGVIPWKNIIEIAGDIDNDTGMPVPGTVAQLELSQFAPPSGVISQPDDAHSIASQQEDDNEDTDDNEDATTLPSGVGGAAPPTPMAKELGRTLHQWQVNARRRVRDGKPPRMFADSVIPAGVQEAIWSRLAKAKSPDEVDFAFELVKSGKVPGPPDWPGHTFTEQIIQHYLPLIGKAQGLDITGIDEAVAQAVNGFFPGHDAHEAADNAIAAHVRVSTDHTADVFRLLYGDAWVAGSRVGQIALKSKTLVKAQNDTTTTTFRVGGGVEQVVAGIDWDSWQPGWGEAADKVASGGLKTMLDQAGITIQGMNATTLSRLGNMLADGLQAGDSIDTIAMQLRSIVGGGFGRITSDGTPEGDAEAQANQAGRARSVLIARTEVARAMSAANVDVYAANDVEQVELLVFDPCDDCEEIADQNPWNTGDIESVPIHPNCRCAWSPIVTGIDTSASSDEG